MHPVLRAATTLIAAVAALLSGGTASGASGRGDSIQIGPRPWYLAARLDEGPLKRELQRCADRPVRRTDFSIAHRGAPLQFPEHTRESYEAAARMGAGIVECDVTFTGDGALVCRHAQNDLHTTTDILVSPLAASCRTPFRPAALDADGKVALPATAECRTSELTLDQFRTLHGKMDGFDPAAVTPQQFQGGTAPWRTDLYSARGTLMTFRESIALNRALGVKHTPELKAGDPQTIAAVFGSQERYAQALIDELRAGGVRPKDAYPQSFNASDVLYWIRHTEYGRQAVFLVDYDADADDVRLADTAGRRLASREQQMAFFRELRAAGVRIVAPAMPALLAVEGSRVVASQLAGELRALGFALISWSFERADLRRGAAAAGFYYDFDPAGAAIRTDGDMYKALDALAREVRVIGVFSDWPATVSYYASCMRLR